MKLTVKEEREYNKLQELWVLRKATSQQILRALDLARKASH